MGTLPALIDHIQLGLPRLLAQFNGKPKIQAWLTGLLSEPNLLEVTIQQLLTLTSIDLSVGAQLDVLGVLLGQARGAMNDVTYQRFLHARVVALQSKGTVGDLYTVLDQTDPGGVFPMHPDYPAKVRIDFSSPTLDAAGVGALQRAALLNTAKAAGVGIYFQWQPTYAGPGAVAIHGDFWAPISPFPGNYTADDDNAAAPHTTTPPYLGMGDFWTPGFGGDVMSGVILV